MRELLVLAAVGLAYYLVARASLSLALVETNVTPLWPPTGIAVVVLFSVGRRTWPAIALAAFLVNAPMSGSLAAAVAIAAGNTAAPLLAAWILKQAGFDERLGRRRDAVAIVLCALTSTLVSATIGSLALVASGVIDSSDFLSSWWVWWAGDAMGVLAVAPLLWTALGLRRRPAIRWRPLLEAVASLGLVAVAAWFALHSSDSRLFVVLPLVAWVAWRFQQVGAAPAAFIVSMMAAWAAADRIGPFAGESLPETMLTLQAFNASVALGSFFLAAVVTDQRRGAAALAVAQRALQARVHQATGELAQAERNLSQEVRERMESEAAFRSVFESAPTGLVQADANGRIVQANAAFQHMVARSARELRAMTFLDVTHPDDVGSSRVHLARLLEGAVHADELETRYLRADGTWFWAQTSASMATDPDGRPRFIHAVIQDLTERRRADALARADAERQRLEEIFLGAPAAVVLTRGPDHIVEFANPVFLASLGGSRECVGMPVRAAFPEADGSGYFELLDRVFITGEPASADEARLRSEGSGEAASDTFFNFVYQPIRDDDGNVSGIFGHEVEVTEMVRARRQVEALATQLARLYEREHQVAETLQRSFLPERLPQLEGSTLAARYVAGSREANVGGDWYDALSVPDGRVVLVIGDVEGRGLAAAAAMGQLRNALRAYAFEGTLPGEALARLSRLVAGSGEERFATVLCVAVSPADGEIRYASAGHLPALAVAADGTTAYLDQALSPPVGVGLSETFAEAHATLEPGSTLVLYTDGLVERRDASLDDGLRRLASVAARGADDPENLVTLLLEELGAEQRHDDIAILAVRRHPVAGRHLRLRLPSVPASVGDLRRQLRPFLHDHGFRDGNLDDVLLAASEAATNAIEHPQGSTDDHFEVEADVVDRQLLLTVRDSGRWRVERQATERGRGLHLMRKLMQVEVETGPDGTEIRLRTALRHP